MSPVPGQGEAAFMATFQELSADNPNLRQQYDEWRELRSQNGEDPADYQAFRQHVIGLGAPDPGEQEIEDFVGDDFKQAHPVSWTRAVKSSQVTTKTPRVMLKLSETGRSEPDRPRQGVARSSR